MKCAGERKPDCFRQRHRWQGANGGVAAGTNGDSRSEHGDVIDQIIGQQAGSEGGTAFTEDAGNAAGGERGKGFAGCDLTCGDQSGGGGCPGAGGRAIGMQQPDGHIMGGAAECAGGGQAKGAVHDHTDGLARGANAAHGKAWVIGNGGASANQNGIM